MINLMAKKASSFGPAASFGFGPGAKSGIDPKEGGPGSGPSPESGKSDSHKGSRVYADGKSFRAITPGGQNIGPFKSKDLLKSHIDKFYPDKEGKEANASSTNLAQLRDPGKKEAEAPKKATFSFRESESASFKNHKFEVVLIKEGLGNLRDRFFYTKESLQSAATAKLFEGSQCFADHPSQIEEESRPERSTRDILGYYENVKYKETDGQGFLVADLIVADNISLDWAMSLLTNSLEYSKKFKEADFVGLSINASGAASSADLDEFVKSQRLSDSVLKKLVDAKAQGVTEINVVNELTEAQSVDLVTKAGAGGRILKMLEQEKKAMKVKESEAVEKKQENEDTKPAQADSSSGATPDHADAGQDKALFAQMVKQYLGKDDASPEEMEMAQHTHEACKEMGMEGQEAYEAAGNHLKMAMAVGKKMASKQTEGAEKKEGEAENKEGQALPPGLKPADSAKKESAQLISTLAENARLKEENKKFTLDVYLDKKLSECGKSNIVTKKFREAIGTPKSKEHIDDTFKIFIKAYEAKAEEVSEMPSDGFLIEKQTYRESTAPSKDVGMNDCLR